jgi:hypothetical protein
MKKGQYVQGINSPFVHGKIVSLEGAFVRLDNGGVYPRCSVQVCSAKTAKQLPDFMTTLSNSKRGLNFR